MDNNVVGSKCPWDTVPTDIEEAIMAIEAMDRWESKNGPVQVSWKPVITSAMFLDLLLRVSDLEQMVAYTGAKALDEDPNWDPYYQ